MSLVVASPPQVMNRVSRCARPVRPMIRQPGSSDTSSASVLSKPTTRPWVVHVLEDDPSRFLGRLAYDLTSEIVSGKAPRTTSALRAGAIAAVNGGYFVVSLSRASTCPGR